MGEEKKKKKRRLRFFSLLYLSVSYAGITTISFPMVKENKVISLCFFVDGNDRIHLHQTLDIVYTPMRFGT